MTELSKHQRKALGLLTPGEWFDPIDIDNPWWPKIRRPRFTAEFLYKKGLLEKEIRGDYPSEFPYFVYRLPESRKPKGA